MSDVAMHGTDASDRAFSGKIMLIVTAVGSLAFIAMLVLGAYAPDLRSGRNGGSHALSNGAIGFSGLVRLAQETGRNPRVIRDEHDEAWQDEALMVVTPDDNRAEMGKILDARGSRATLIVLPKWEPAADQTHPGWVRIEGLTLPSVPEGVLAPGLQLKITRSKGHGEPFRNLDSSAPAAVRFVAPAVVQAMSGKLLRPLITTAEGEIVLAKVADRPFYVLSEPDLLNNHGMGNEQQAASALALLDYLNSTGANGVFFDVTANGLGRSRSPLKLAFDPPFLGVTLILFAAMLLAGWQALVRFGDVRRPQRAIAFGKAALVDNSAALIRKAGRESRLGGRYAEMIRERAIDAFRLPSTAGEEVLASRLEALNPDRSFAATAEAAREAGSRDQLLGAARNLHQWFEEVQQ